ncbi:hypothetical protein ACU8KH_05545 [Lachancea thermotolerans]
MDIKSKQVAQRTNKQKRMLVPFSTDSVEVAIYVYLPKGSNGSL